MTFKPLVQRLVADGDELELLYHYGKYAIANKKGEILHVFETLDQLLDASLPFEKQQGITG